MAEGTGRGEKLLNLVFRRTSSTDVWADSLPLWSL